MNKKIRPQGKDACYLTLANAQNHSRVGQFDVWTGLLPGVSKTDEIGFALLPPLSRGCITESGCVESDLAIAIGLPFGCREQALEHGCKVAQGLSLLYKRIEQSDAMPQDEANARLAALTNQLSPVGEIK
ncbi:MAG: hypothetical protein AAFY26_06030 [Cyanobacteria bacterium J06638_22]